MPIQVDLSKKHIAQAQYVVAFVRDREIRLKQQLVEKSFGSLFGGRQSVQTNVPDEFSGSAPRIILNAKNKGLAVSQVALTLSLQFEAAEGATAKQLVIIEKNILDFEQGLSLFQKTGDLRETGLVLVVNYPSEDSASELGKHIYKHFISFAPLGEVATTQAMLGFRLDDKRYLTLSFGAYETHQGEALAAVSAGRVIVDPAELPVVAQGIEAKIDVNDKPRLGLKVPGRRDITSIIEKSKTMVLSEVDKMLGLA